MSEILIASSSVSEATYSPVVNNLNNRGYDIVLYLSDRVAHGYDVLSYSINEDGKTQFVYKDKTIELDKVSAAWYHHPNVINLPETDAAKRISVEQEINNLQEFLWRNIPIESWLNAPQNMDRIDIKLGQLVVAQSLGFNIPKTIISNDWRYIERDLGQQETMIIKMIRGVLLNEEETKILYTSIIDPKTREALRDKMPFPGIFQEYKNKLKEWRITVVGNKVFEAAIYTDNDAKDDWRKHQFTKRVIFKKEEIDDSIKEKCINFLKYYELGYGAFDLIEDTNGQITFLECNSNGQFMWLEKLLNLPISNAIANELIKISKENTD